MMTSKSNTVDSTVVMSTGDKERKRAHRLLVELLAYQFAFPVNWIDTQKNLISRNPEIKRFVEFGPAKVLGGLMRRTIEARFPSKDIANAIGINRKFISCEQDGDELRYVYDDPVPMIDYYDKIAEPKKESIPAIPVPPVATAMVHPEHSVVRQTTISDKQDAPIPAKEIIRCLIAYKLKKNWQSVSSNKTIKELSGGRSTLQNELLADLGHEFGNLPDGAEDISLDAFSQALGVSHTGHLGKQSTTLIAKFISSKMPSGWNSHTIREYIQTKWGFGPLLQDAVLLIAITSEPPSRLATVDAAKAYFDGLVSLYAAANSISVQETQAQSDDREIPATLIDASQLLNFEQKQYALASKQLNALAEHLNIDIRSEDEKIENSLEILQQKLDLWRSEFAEEFEHGIQPCFNPTQGRRFGSPWNTAREDLLRLYHDAENGRFDEKEENLESKILHLSNRADSSLQKMLETLVGLSIEQNTLKTGFSMIGRMLMNTIKIPARPVFRYLSSAMAPCTRISPTGIIEYTEIHRLNGGATVSYTEIAKGNGIQASTKATVPFLHIKRKQDTTWKIDQDYTKIFHECLDVGTAEGFSFMGKNILVTGAGPDSIAIEVVRGLLMGGAHVIMTTSRPPAESAKFCQQLYAENGANGSELMLMRFNQGSAQDCEALIDYIYADSGLGRILDIIIPFAAISEHGSEVDGLSARSELAHRLMMVNTLRLLGSEVQHKRNRHINTRPTLVLLPLSSNHGTFGGDGLYGESKLGLESLFNRFNSESWSDYLLICGTAIGWTRGTGLMDSNDILAAAVESHGILTFTTKEMAFNLLALLSEPITRLCEIEPIWVDLNGGLQLLTNLKEIVSKARSQLQEISSINKAVHTEDQREYSLLEGPAISESDKLNGRSILRSTLEIGFPRLPHYEQEIAPLQYLQGTADLKRTIVVVGFSELGPLGSSRTRWDKEIHGTFSQNGFIEMARMMKLIKRFDGEEKGGHHYVGWVDAKTGTHVRDDEVGKIYGNEILSHSGIRIVESDIHGGYDADKKEYLHEVVVEEDLPAFDATRATAEAFKLRHKDKVRIWQSHTDNLDEFRVQLKQGATIMLPKSASFGSIVAGQIPTGWDASTYGIPEEVISQVDPVTLYTLCCASEALYSAGITDPFEIYKYMHVSQLGIFLGSSLGGLSKTRQMYKDRYLDKLVPVDVIQETNFNTPSAWVNMLLLGSAGPIKTLTGACATSVESLDSGCESILGGKTKMCLVGGLDDMIEEDVFAFSTMKATVDARKELSKGRLPKEMSRPTAESRAGFVESHGCGMQIITTAEVALEMGLPIYGIIASSTMAADGIGRSIPAPGQGVLSFARETSRPATSPFSDTNYQQAGIESCVSQGLSSTTSLSSLGMDIPTALTPLSPTDSSSTTSPYSTNQHRISRECQKNWTPSLQRVCHAQDHTVSPLRASLAAWGLGIDDIDVVSMHGTSTRANEKNEAEVIHKEMNHLGRTIGRPIPAICQKSMTGHPKAAAAAWMLNGCLQAMNDATIPGNQNADTVDDDLEKYSHLVFPTRCIHVREIKAFLLNSFGFGQKGGQVVGISPKYLFGAISKSEMDEYIVKVTERKRKAKRAYIKAIATNNVVQIKQSSPYEKSDASRVYLDPLARIPRDVEKELQFKTSNLHGLSTKESKATQKFQSESSKFIGSAMKDWTEMTLSQNNNKAATVGVDVEEIDSFSHNNHNFINRNFTAAEQSYSAQSVNPKLTLAGRWCLKEAVFKSLRLPSAGAGSPMIDIEIVNDRGMPVVKLHGDTYQAATKQGIESFQLSLSHNETTVMAVALAFYGSGNITY